MTVEDWLSHACADADRRGLPELKPLLASLADATRNLRGVEWGEAQQADREAPIPDRAADAPAQAAGGDEAIR